MSTRAELKSRAKEAMSGHLLTYIAAHFLPLMILNVVFMFVFMMFGTAIMGVGSETDGSPIVSFIFSICYILYLLCACLISVGIVRFCESSREGNCSLEEVKYGFTNIPKLGIFTFIRIWFFTCLWSLIPIAGIVLGPIKALSYSMSFFLITDEDVDIESGKDAVDTSKAMMHGHKMDLFVLYLSFIPWWLLSMLVVPAFYVVPYMNATLTEFYYDIRDEYMESQE